MKDQIENHRIVSDKEFEEIKECWFVLCGGKLRRPVMDSMQRRVVVWAIVGWFIGAGYILLALGVWYAVSWVGALTWAGPR